MQLLKLYAIATHASCTDFAQPTYAAGPGTCTRVSELAFNPIGCMQILRFYQHKGMALPEKPPLMLVETSALNAAEEKEGRTGTGHNHGPVFHTRGLTLTLDYNNIQHVTTRGGRQITQPMDLSARNRYEVCGAHVYSLLRSRVAVCNTASMLTG